ncbi:hypothetical protein [Campylobacter upsaliensis]|uniref:hypothetical protein n=1 Tax=Campylobacter upsaliensis TaxID=28080 RepID=UPI0018F0F1E3|nr:hypothetical protein [Campylobacter upsaliensis]MBJ6809626.1 hypothetical protein [Campylobacter upsaliensis]
MTHFISKIDTSSKLTKAVEGSEAGMIKAFLATSQVKKIFNQLVSKAALGKSFSTDVNVSDGDVEWNIELYYDKGRASISVVGFNDEQEWDSGEVDISKEVIKAIKAGDAKRNIESFYIKPTLDNIDLLIRALKKDPDATGTIEDMATGTKPIERLENIKVKFRKAKDLSDLLVAYRAFNTQLITIEGGKSVASLIKRIKKDNDLSVNVATKVISNLGY